MIVMCNIESIHRDDSISTITFVINEIISDGALNSDSLNIKYITRMVVTTSVMYTDEEIKTSCDIITSEYGELYVQ